MNTSYPPTVRLKKLALVLVLISAGLIATVIIYNLSVSTKASRCPEKPSEKGVKTVANASDMTWYHENEMHLPEQISPTKTAIANSSNLPSHATLSSLDPDTVKAMSSPISNNQILAESATNMMTSSSVATTKETRASLLKNASSPYLIQPGTFIPAILITGINSDLPGQIIAQVRENVYDSLSGQHLLIPQGSKLIGVYDAKIVYGQERVLVAWQRLLLPNGQSMDLQDMAGVDNSGYAGFNDQVNAHYGKLLSAAALTSVLGASAQLLQPQMHAGLSENNNTLTVSLAQNAGVSLIHTASELTNKNLNIQPTLEIRPGYTFNVSVTKELIFNNAYEEIKN